MAKKDGMPKKPPIVVICGPTGVGKTSVGIEMATAFQGEIVSADSMQVYRYMDIGTAKPTPAEQSRAPHHMIDIVDPDQPFDAARYTSEARRLIKRLHIRSLLPFVVGGTGLYIKALTRGLFEGGEGHPEARKRLHDEIAACGIEHLHHRLGRCDPETAQKIHPHDTYRIMRALEIFETTQQPISLHQKTHRFSESRYDVLKIGLTMDKALLYDRINHRVDAMLADGLQNEVESLLARGYARDLKSMQSIGYRHMVDLISERISREEAVRTLKRDTRRYAKRQLTWFRSDQEIVWVPPHEKADIRRIVADYIQTPDWLC